MKKLGFTLAEILIAIAVIGVISAVTVPVLMQNTNKQEYVTALKKAYSTLSQVTNQIIAEEGSPKTDEKGYTWMADGKALYDMYKKYLITAKECGSGADCFSKSYKNLTGKIDTYAETGLLTSAGKYHKLILQDGVSIAFDYNVSKTCTNSWENKKNDCAQIFVDINGHKAPNIWGIDTFSFILRENGLYPRGCYNTNGCSRKNLYNLSCACKVLKEDGINY